MPQANFHQALRERFTDFVPHVKDLGLRVSALDELNACLHLPFREDWLGDTERGLIHTGVISSMIDTASGLAVFARLANFEPIATLDLRMDYLRPALRERDLHCKAECYRVSSHIAFVRASAWQMDEAEPVAVSQSVFMRASHSKARSERPV